MVLLEITKIFERRRAELYNLLEKRKDELKPELQHQIYGAMNEIDIFLKTIEYYKEKETDHEMNRALLVGPMIRDDMMTRIVKKISKLKQRKKGADSHKYHNNQ
jgi:hypothetical protein